MTKKKTPKLICQTPVLHRAHGDWCDDGGRDWLCMKTIRRLWEIPTTTRHVRAYLYNGQPAGSDAVRVRLMLRNKGFLWSPDATEVCWTSGKSATPRGELLRAVEGLLKCNLFSDCPDGTIKTVWAEIEFED